MKTLTVAPALFLFALRLFAQVEPVASDTQHPAAVHAIEKEAHLEYISQYKEVAIREMYRTGIPASITLAQAILESGGGASELARRANNHFGIKCDVTWSGKTYNKVDDAKDAGGNPIASCFRKYGEAEESFYDHSEFICDPAKSARYGFLFHLDMTDYKAWAYGLQTAGYASDADYANKLIDLIERYSLFQYDRPEIPPSDSVRFQILYRVSHINRKKAVLSRSNERLEDIARIFNLSVEKLAEFNDLAYVPGLPLPPNTRVFIEEKRKKWRGRPDYHIVQEGQTMLELSQWYGVKLPDLLKRNGLKTGQEPMAGEQVRLRGRSLSSGTALRTRDDEQGINSPGAKRG